MRSAVIVSNYRLVCNCCLPHLCHSNQCQILQLFKITDNLAQARINHISIGQPGQSRSKSTFSKWCLSWDWFCKAIYSFNLKLTIAGFTWSKPFFEEFKFTKVGNIMKSYRFLQENHSVKYVGNFWKDVNFSRKTFTFTSVEPLSWPVSNFEVKI